MTRTAPPSPELATHASAGDPPPASGSPADRGTTRTVVQDDEPLRLPHERDESSDSGVRAPSEGMRQAGRELQAGQADAPRGPATQRRYSDLTAQAGGQARPAEAAAAPPAPARAGASGSTTPAGARMDDAEHQGGQQASSSLSPEDLAKKRAVLRRARADHAIKGEPTSGLPEQAERGRAEDVVPPPGGQTDQTR